MRALIIEDGSARSALTAVRSLKRAGIDVAVASPRRGLAARSRYCLGWHQVPPAHFDDFLSELARVCEQHRYEVVLPAGDVELIAVSHGRSSLPTQVPLPPHEVVEGVVNKLRLAATMAGTDVAMPATAEATETFLESADYPIILKPDLQWAPGRPPPSARLDVRVLTGRETAKQRAAELRADGAVPVAQPVVSGRLVALAAVVAKEGDLRTVVAQEATKMWPPGRGISAAATTIDAEPFRPLLTEIVRATGWIGLLQAQVLRQGSEAVLIDINVRLYGSISLAVAAGANLPALWVHTATQPPSHRTDGFQAPAGVRYQWLEGDLKRAFRQRERGLLADLVGVAGRAVTSHHSVSSWRDPVPSLEALRMMGRDLRASRSAG